MKKKAKLREQVYKYHMILLTVALFLIMYCFFRAGYGRKENLVIYLSGDKIQNLQILIEQQPISWQKNIEGDKYNLFLPSGITAKKANIALCYDCTEGTDAIENTTLLFDGKEVNDYTSVDLAEGEHTITTSSGKWIFSILRSANLSSVYMKLHDDLSVLQGDINAISSGSIQILSSVGELEYSGEIEEIHGHGNSSWDNYAKKSFQIKLEKEASLLGLNKEKKFLLIANSMDRTMMRNKLFYDMAIKVGLVNAIDSTWTDLYINGEYQGCYLMTEKIDISSEQLDIGNLEKETKDLNMQDIGTYPNYHVEENNMTIQGWQIPYEPENLTGGYLLEVDYPTRYDAEPSKFITKNEQYVVIKNPSYTTVNQTLYISNFVQEFEDAIYSTDGKNEQTGKHYSEYIDLQSFAKRYIIDEISKNIDAGYSSWFFYKPRNSSKMYAGPIWDYDTALGNAGGWGDVEKLTNPDGFYANEVNWTKQIYSHSDFKSEVVLYYNLLFKANLENITHYKIQDYANQIEKSVQMDAQLYGYSTEEWNTEIEEMSQFLKKRTAFLNQQWNEKG